MIIAVIGARVVPANNPLIPAIINPPSVNGWLGNIPFTIKYNKKPINDPIKIDGDIVPPEPPELKVKDVANTFKITIAKITYQIVDCDNIITLAVSYPMPIIWGAKIAIIPIIKPPKIGENRGCNLSFLLKSISL